MVAIAQEFLVGKAGSKVGRPRSRLVAFLNLDLGLYSTLTCGGWGNAETIVAVALRLAPGNGRSMLGSRGPCLVIVAGRFGHGDQPRTANLKMSSRFRWRGGIIKFSGTRGQKCRYLKSPSFQACGHSSGSRDT